jgi:glycosyltransferase involved in cell wall biosynthesis
MGRPDPFQYARGRGLNVGLLAMGWPPDLGGVPSHTADLARELQQRGHQLYVLCLDTSGARPPFALHDSVVDGVAVRRVSYAYGDHRRLFDLAVHRGLDDVVLGWMAEHPCDLIHVHHLSGFGAGALRAVHDVGQPLLLTLHDYWLLDPRGQLFRPDGSLRAPGDAAALAADLRATWPHLLPSGGAPGTGERGEELGDDEAVARAYLDHARRCLALPHRLVTPSAAAAAVFVAAGVPAERLVVVENGVRAAQLREQVERLRRPRPAGVPLRLGVLGTVLPSKGALELAEAFLEADVPGLELVIAGNLVSYHGDSSYGERLRTLLAGQPRLHWRGEYQVSELPALLAELDGVAAPSLWEEVYGLTVREARAAGLPVLVSDAGALPEVTDGGRAGLVVPRRDRGAWIAALRRFATDTPARTAWAAHPAPVRSSAQMAEQLEQLYLETIEATTGERPDLTRAGAQPSAPPDRSPASTRARPTAPAPKPGPKSFWSRLFGR